MTEHLPKGQGVPRGLGRGDEEAKAGGLQWPGPPGPLCVVRCGWRTGAGLCPSLGPPPPAPRSRCHHGGSLVSLAFAFRKPLPEWFQAQPHLEVQNKISSTLPIPVVADGILILR